MLVDHVGPTGQRGKSMQLALHVGSLVEGTGNKGLTVAQRHASRYLHVHLHLGCNLCPTGVPGLEVGMDTDEDLYKHLL